MPEEDGKPPLTIVEDADTGHRFVVYAGKEGLRFELRCCNSFSFNGMLFPPFFQSS